MKYDQVIAQGRFSARGTGCNSKLINFKNIKTMKQMLNRQFLNCDVSVSNFAPGSQWGHI